MYLAPGAPPCPTLSIGSTSFEDLHPPSSTQKRAPREKWGGLIHGKLPAWTLSLGDCVDGHRPLRLPQTATGLDNWISRPRLEQHHHQSGQEGAVWGLHLCSGCTRTAGAGSSTTTDICSSPPDVGGGQPASGGGLSSNTRTLCPPPLRQQAAELKEPKGSERIRLGIDNVG